MVVLPLLPLLYGSCHDTLRIRNQGKVQAVDRKSDLALLKCNVPDGRELPVAKIGHSIPLRAGEFVVAMGSPKGLANTCTLGIVSATARPRSELGERALAAGTVISKLWGT